MKEKISIIGGCGHVGLPLAVTLAKNKLPANKFKIANLNIIFILLYNSFMNIFLSPLEKGAIFISEIVYKIFNI